MTNDIENKLKEIEFDTALEGSLHKTDVLDLIKVIRVQQKALEYYSGDFDGKEGTRWNKDTLFFEDKFGSTYTANGAYFAKQAIETTRKLLGCE